MTFPSIKEVLVDAKKLIADESGWCQGDYARNANNEYTPWNNNDAVRFCLLGAVFRSIFNLDAERLEVEVITHLHTVIPEGKETIKCDRSVFYNDHHTHPEVVALIDKAINTAP